MKKNKLLLIFIVITLILTSLLFSFNAFADDVDWQYNDQNHTLYITGSGAMDNYEDEYSIPWSAYAAAVEKVVISEGITTIGDYSFSGLKVLSSVDIPDTVTTVGSNSFASCPALNELSFSKSITSISDSSFAYNGTSHKNDFILKAPAGSFAYAYAFANSITTDCPSIECAQYDVSIYVNAMNAVYPFTPKYDGTYTFYSSGTLDTKATLYNSSRNPIADNDDAPSLSNGNFSITYELQKGETYYISTALYSKGMRGTFNLNVAADSFTYSGTVNAMLLPDGTPSDIILSDALVDGEPAGSFFEIEITGSSKPVEFTFNGMSKTVELTPNSAPVTTFVVCDVNSDGYVNAKDYAIMKQTSSPYIDLFGNFINYDFS